MSMLRFVGWLLLAVIVVIVDQASKHWIMSAFVVGDRLPLTPFFNLVLVFNSGAAFSFLASAGGWQRWIFVTLALVISVWIVILLRQHSAERLKSCSLALILGGALGNVVDRFVHGAVLDFLDFYIAGWHFPAFNVADSAISLGVVLMLWHEFFRKKLS